MKTNIKFSFSCALIAFLSLTAIHLTGCDQKEKVLDVETRNGGLEIERSEESGEVDIEIGE